MKISLHSKKRISFTVHEKRLKDALDNCDLGTGNAFNPIPVDGFITTKRSKKSTFYAGDTITMEFKNKSDKYNFQVVCCVLRNVGINFNSGSMPTLNPWANIFVYENGNGAILLPNGTLCLTPVNQICAISIPENPTYEPNAALNYVSYSIIFSLTVEENNRPRMYYFIIDPLLKISSNPPNGGN